MQKFLFLLRTKGNHINPSVMLSDNIVVYYDPQNQAAVLAGIRQCLNGHADTLHYPYIMDKVEDGIFEAEGVVLACCDFLCVLTTGCLQSPCAIRLAAVVRNRRAKQLQSGRLLLEAMSTKPLTVSVSFFLVS